MSFLAVVGFLMAGTKIITNLQEREALNAMKTIPAPLDRSEQAPHWASS